MQTLWEHCSQEYFGECVKKKKLGNVLKKRNW
jgi:hypothetical protein